MATPGEKLAESLQALKELQDKDNSLVIYGTTQLSRTHRDRLKMNGWLQEVLKGWYIVSKPGTEGDTTVWYSSFWNFIKAYCNRKYGNQWVLSPELSLDRWSGSTVIARQCVVRTLEGANNVTNLLYGTSIFPIRSKLPETIVKDPVSGVNVYTLEEALINVSPSYFVLNELTAKICLSLVRDSSAILRLLADNGASVRAGRIAGAFRHIGRSEIADDILMTMRGFGYDVREMDPFEKPSGEHLMFTSPYEARITLMWKEMREQILPLIDMPERRIDDVRGYMNSLEEKYKDDAYHSLSIEGYKISAELIDKVKSGNWNPDVEDKENKNALVARGYYLAFQSVKDSVLEILEGGAPGVVAKKDHQQWYLQMWSPFVGVGLLKASDLIGYRNNQVYIRGSLHTPLSPDNVRITMPVLFKLLANEPSAIVRAVLGHFFFGYIHPYMDGNGRMCRFLMNVMLASGGYDWVVIKTDKRAEYMAALETASTKGDILPFAKFVISILRQNVDFL